MLKKNLSDISTVLSRFCRQSEWLVGNSQTIADIAVVAQLGEVIRTSKKFSKEILNRPFIALWYKKQTG